MQNTDHERAGFDLGWDIARVGYGLSADTKIGACVANGITAGRMHFGAVKPVHCRYERKLIQIRIGAHRRTIPFATESVDVDFLKSIDVEYCPITRIRLTHSSGQDTDWSVDRLHNNVGYVAGNLAIMSSAANKEKDTLDFAGLARRAINHTLRPRDGFPLQADAWQRLWTLVSYSLAVPDAEVHAWPLVICPPTWVPIAPAWRLKLCLGYVADHGMPHGKERALLDGKKELRVLHAFCEAKRYANGRAQRTLNDRHGTPRSDIDRWSIEDAGREPLVNHAYARLLGGISVSSQAHVLQFFTGLIERRKPMSAARA